MLRGVSLFGASFVALPVKVEVALMAFLVGFPDYSLALYGNHRADHYCRARILRNIRGLMKYLYVLTFVEFSLIVWYFLYNPCSSFLHYDNQLQISVAIVTGTTFLLMVYYSARATGNHKSE